MGYFFKLKNRLEDVGCKFVKNELTLEWECSYEGSVIASHKYLGDCVRLAGVSFGEV